MSQDEHTLKAIRYDAPVAENSLLQVAFEHSRHRYFLSQCDLPGSAEQKIEGLRRWYSDAVSRRELAVCWLLCKTQCIKIGTIGVRICLSSRFCSEYVLITDAASHTIPAAGHRSADERVHARDAIREA